MPEVVIAMVKLDPRDPIGDEILDKLEGWASFGSGGPENIGGHRGRHVHVGNVETENVARNEIAESLDDLAPQWREHLRFFGAPGPKRSVVITCPKTGQEVPTGLRMDEQGLAAATLTDNPLDCPACGQTHDWDISEARLADD
jgi:hypothetical protein